MGKETLKLTCGPKERDKGRLSRGNCICKDMDTQETVAPSGNHSGVVLGESELAGDCRVGLAGRGQIHKGLAKDLRHYPDKYLSWNTLSFSASPGSQLKPPSSLFPDPGLGQIPYCALSKLPVLGVSSS